MKAILDTSILIATDVPPLEGELAISAAALAELHFGVLVTADPAVRADRLRRLSGFQRRFTALPVDDAVATPATANLLLRLRLRAGSRDVGWIC